MTRKGWGASEWWSKNLWKLKCLEKARFFFWCILQTKIPTWDILQSRYMHGPGRCTLCKFEAETINHLFLTCSETKKVWGEVGKLMKKKVEWVSENLP